MINKLKKRLVKIRYTVPFQFRYTATQRAQQSAIYFATGLFGEKQAKKLVFPPARKVDKVLRVRFF